MGTAGKSASRFAPAVAFCPLPIRNRLVRGQPAHHVICTPLVPILLLDMCTWPHRLIGVFEARFSDAGEGH